MCKPLALIASLSWKWPLGLNNVRKGSLGSRRTRRTAKSDHEAREKPSLTEKIRRSKTPPGARAEHQYPHNVSIFAGSPLIWETQGGKFFRFGLHAVLTL